jgi:hypothetical protein
VHSKLALLKKMHHTEASVYRTKQPAEPFGTFEHALKIEESSTSHPQIVSLAFILNKFNRKNHQFKKSSNETKLVGASSSHTRKLNEN